MTTPALDAWLRGPIAGIPALLQPAAHALTMAREDIEAATAGLSHDQLWSRPSGITPIGFHLAHLAGSTGRLMTYATGQRLSDAQKAFLLKEQAVMDTKPSLEGLLADFRSAFDAAMAQLSATPEASLTEVRLIGKARLPTTVIGAIFHAAEHASRHAGQIVTTAKLLK